MALQLQMNWQPSLLSQKRRTGPPLGLKNLGNSCYLNSVLQCLTYTPPLANFCLKLQHSSLCERGGECPFCILEKRIRRSLSVDLALDAPSKLQNCLRIFAEHFKCGRQEDAHEFLRYVIDACHNTCLRLKKLQQQRRYNNGCKGGENVSNGSSNGCSNSSSGGSSVVKEIFGGALQSQVKCLSCGNESNKVDEIMDISLDVLLSNSLKDAFQKFFQSEVLDGNNKYKCDNCKKLVAARKQMSIRQAPNVLVIQLKRFESVFGGKIDKAIAFEEVLVLSSFMCKASQDPRPEYKLFGTIVHSGYSQESGHYYAYIKDAMGRWYCCNDSFVSVSTLQEVLSEKVYILFFSRTNQRPASASTALASNGIRSRDCNGSEAFKSPKAALPMKSVHPKASFDQSFQKDVSTIPKGVKVPSSPRMRFNLSNSNSKRPLANGNGKLDAHKILSMEANGDVKASNSTEKSEKNVANMNGFNKTKNVDVADSKNNKAFTLTVENGISQRGDINLVKPDVGEVNGTMSRVTVRGPDHHELGTFAVNGHAEISGSQRKSKDEGSCILLAQDSLFQEKFEELKEVLKKEAFSLEKEAFSVLRSCGWSDKVFSFMSSKKRLREEAGNGPSSTSEFKKLLIADARPTFTSQIPESLKEDLIEQLRSICEGKKAFSRTLIN
ncbi:ubiquitin carboxyl-terminal hydrolase 25 [Quercus lobata]|uniref:ubiquitin carboxyl-terminal hydrolase 25 n=1 Tax=Quercus lobata TaxID=97700 RepID=UPI0012449DDA|nr:ubiquitin carboxyl-terminal hydrolase 25 [Quercus lobata]